MMSGQSIFKHKIPSASDQLLLAMQNATSAHTMRAGELPITTKAAFQTGKVTKISLWVPNEFRDLVG